MVGPQNRCLLGTTTSAVVAKTLQIHIDNIIVHDEKHHNLGAAQQLCIIGTVTIAAGVSVAISVVRAEHADSPNEFTLVEPLARQIKFGLCSVCRATAQW